jgi:hypothetical protein
MTLLLRHATDYYYAIDYAIDIAIAADITTLSHYIYYWPLRH